MRVLFLYKPGLENVLQYSFTILKLEIFRSCASRFLAQSKLLVRSSVTNFQSDIFIIFAVFFVLFIIEILTKF